MRSKWWTAALIATLCLGRFAAASVVQDLDEPQLLQRSAVVGVMAVVGKQTLQLAEGAVATAVQLQVHRAVKGCQAGEQLAMLLPGGNLHGLVHQVSGAPEVQHGQMLVAFLEGTSPQLRPLGLSLGIYYVEGSSQRHWQVRRNLTGLSLLRHGIPRVAATAQVGRSPHDLAEPLEPFLARLDRPLAASAAER